MEKLVISGGKALQGSITPTGAKNVAMKTIVAAMLSSEKVTVRNIPLISSVTGTAAIVKPLNVKVSFSNDKSVVIDPTSIFGHKIPLELGGLYRTATMTIAPLLARFGKAIVPNPGGCRLGKRPIERHIEGLKAMGADIEYKDGFFFAQTKGLQGTRFKFTKNTHTGTETLIMAASLAKGKTTIENAALEPEIDDLIAFLNSMGAKIRRCKDRSITIEGVNYLHGTDFTIMPDRNEVVTFAIGAYVTGGDILVKNIKKELIAAFLEKLKQANADFETDKRGIRFYTKSRTYKATNIATKPEPGFMTDWQAPWALFATLCNGTSTIHETVYESRFGYVSELCKMGARIDFYNPKVSNPAAYYNFNWEDRNPLYYQGIKIHGPTKLHNAVVEVGDLRAGATLVLAALGASGQSVVLGLEHIDRGYENFENRLVSLGASIKRLKE